MVSSLPTQCLGGAGAASLYCFNLHPSIANWIMSFSYILVCFSLLTQIACLYLNVPSIFPFLSLPRPKDPFYTTTAVKVVILFKVKCPTLALSPSSLSWLPMLLMHLLLGAAHSHHLHACSLLPALAVCLTPPVQGSATIPT